MQKKISYTKKVIFKSYISFVFLCIMLTCIHNTTHTYKKHTIIYTHTQAHIIKYTYIFKLFFNVEKLKLRNFMISHNAFN